MLTPELLQIVRKYHELIMTNFAFHPSAVVTAIKGGDYKTKTKDQRPKMQDPKSTICGLLQNENEKAISISQSRNQSATWATSVKQYLLYIWHGACLG